MVITHEKRRKADLIKLCGRLSLQETPNLRTNIRELVENGARNLVLDLEDVSFIDSSGLSVLVSALKQCNARQGSVLLLHPSAAARALLELTRLHYVFEIFEDEDAAIRQVELMA